MKSILSLAAVLSLDVGPVTAESKYMIQTDKVLQTLPPEFKGCHSDLGYMHQDQGWSTQMIWGSSFETGYGQWDTSGSDAGTAFLDPTRGYVGMTSLRYYGSFAHSRATAWNLGYNNMGFRFTKGRDYRVSFWATATGVPTANITMELRDTVTSARIGTASFVVDGPPGLWQQYKGTITPSASTTCVDTPGSCSIGPQKGHVCLKCTGAFHITMSGFVPMLLVDAVELAPGNWARVYVGPSRAPAKRTILGPHRQPKVHRDDAPDDHYLPVWRAVADAVDAMGMTMVRFGGSYAGEAGHFWKSLRGPTARRPPVSWGDTSDYGAWGPFEMIDVCAAYGWRPLITLFGSTWEGSRAQPEDFADLVEYVWGGPNTFWGSVRVADGHPEPYAVDMFEIGNEEEPPQWVEIVLAMEAKAAELGRAKELTFFWPSNPGWSVPGVLDRVRAMGGQIVWDIHSNGWDSTHQAIREAATRAVNGSEWRMMNLETNAGIDGPLRASMELFDINAQFNYATSRVFGRAASFCFGKSGDFDGFEQALMMVHPAGWNDTTGHPAVWLQPAGYVHTLLAAQWGAEILIIDGVDGTRPRRFPATSIGAARGDGYVSVRINIPPAPTAATAALAAELSQRGAGAAEVGAALKEYVASGDDWAAGAEAQVLAQHGSEVRRGPWVVRGVNGVAEWFYNVELRMSNRRYDAYTLDVMWGAPDDANAFEDPTRLAPTRVNGRLSQSNYTVTLPATSIAFFLFQ